MKKAISFLVVSLMLMSFVVASAKELTNEQKADLYSYGIMIGDENGDLRLNASITRAEAIKMICCARKIDLSSSDNLNNKFFKDIPQNHWAIKYINTAKAVGIVDDKNSNFNPDNEITYNEIIKMIVSVLGYSPMADARGGYPVGYVMTAKELGLTKSLSFKNEDIASRNDAAILISNSLDIPIMVQTRIDFGTEQPNAEYQIANGENGTKLITLRSMLNEAK